MVARKTARPGRLKKPPPTPRELLDRTTTEKAYQQQIVDYARLRGYLVYHPFDSRRSTPGFPDVVLAKPGCRMLFLEVKRENGRLSAAQREWLHTIQATGNYARVVRPSDWKIVTQLLGDELPEIDDLQEATS